MKKKTLPTAALDISPAAAVHPRPVAFTKEFKVGAVERMRLRQQSATALALELGIRRNQLYKWAKALDEQGEGGSFKGPGRLPADQESEVVRLRSDLASVKEELAILKKFDAYLTRKKQ